MGERSQIFVVDKTLKDLYILKLSANLVDPFGRSEPTKKWNYDKNVDFQSGLSAKI